MSFVEGGMDIVWCSLPVPNYLWPTGECSPDAGEQPSHGEGGGHARTTACERPILNFTKTNVYCKEKNAEFIQHAHEPGDADLVSRPVPQAVGTGCPSTMGMRAPTDM